MHLIVENFHSWKVYRTSWLALSFPAVVWIGALILDVQHTLAENAWVEQSSQMMGFQLFCLCRPWNLLRPLFLQANLLRLRQKYWKVWAAMYPVLKTSLLCRVLPDKSNLSPHLGNQNR
jgi:hypothetical protein